MTAEQSRAARELLNWSRVRLGAKSNLSEDTIREFEIGRRIPNPGTLTRIRQALEGSRCCLYTWRAVANQSL
ncbi:helix-turn-helix domain-containing protein [Mesorhizobium sp. LjNodule214]|uniref:helix-turn-helix domain-containing protein n=1 Tax=Mesorhizobium sp. LjNodule214 TaxID=3342252 RepID=UPI003ECFA55F